MSSNGDDARDLVADLAVCEKATPGMWAESFRGSRIDVYQAGGEHIATLHCDEPSLLHSQREDDAIFIARAREGWPHAIRRALAAEKRVRELEQGTEDIYRGADG